MINRYKLLWNLTGSNSPGTIAANDNSGSSPIDIGDVSDLWLAVFVAGTSTGTSPTLDVQLDVQDADGNWFLQVAKIAQITAGPGSGSVSAGLHAGSGYLVLPRYCRVAWTAGGTSPVFPKTSIALYGR